MRRERQVTKNVTANLDSLRSTWANKQQTNKQILYYPQTLYSVQGVKTSNKYIVVRHLQHKYI